MLWSTYKQTLNGHVKLAKENEYEAIWLANACALPHVLGP